jgi:hypothetical protein
MFIHGVESKRGAAMKQKQKKRDGSVEEKMNAQKSRVATIMAHFAKTQRKENNVTAPFILLPSPPPPFLLPLAYKTRTHAHKHRKWH